MLSTLELKEVWCETYDDIVLVWNTGTETIEFIQVKAKNMYQLWTPAYLCKREKSKEKPDGIGSSVLEKSLARDNCEEETQFRLATTRDVSSQLELLKLERKHSDRMLNWPKMTDLCRDITARIDGFQSEKGNDCRYWLEKVAWEVHTCDGLEHGNKRLLTAILEGLRISSYIDTVDRVYQDLLSLVKTAAEQPWANREKKKIVAEGLRSFIESSIDPYPMSGQNEKLRRKLSQAGLDTTYIDTAQDLRRAYLSEMRSARYLETEGREYYTNGALNTLLLLRSKLDSGLLQLDGVTFHQRCLESLEQLVQKRPATLVEPPQGFIAGCLYEITSRCQHRFTKLNS